MSDRPREGDLERAVAAHQAEVARYELGRLTAGRAVRAALALTRLPKGPAAAREAWRSPRALNDPGPRPDPHQREAHLRVAHLSATPLTDATCPGVRLTATSWRTQLEVQRPDVVFLDVPAPWVDARVLREMRSLVGGALVTTSQVARSGGHERFDLVIDVDDPDAALAPAVDHRVHSPVGAPTDPVGVASWTPGSPYPDLDTAVVTVDDTGGGAAVLTGALQLAARGTVVVSPGGGRIARALADAAVTGSPYELAAVAESIAGDPSLRERTSVRQRRHVLSRHTIDDRARQLLAEAGVRLRPPPRVTVLLATRRPEELATALARVTAQRWADLEVQLLLHGFGSDVPARAAAGRRVEVHEVPADLPLGAVLDVGLDAASGELIAKMDDDDLYGTGHLPDLTVALRYSGADLVGRWANFSHLTDTDQTVDAHRDRQERWAHHLPGATMLAHGSVLRRLRWRHVPNGVDRELIRALHADGGRAYATHRYGFVRRRHGDHTFAKGDRSFAREGVTTPGLDLRVLEV